MQDFNLWISQKYIEWRGDKIGRAGTVSAYSRWVGVTQSTMSYWMSGDNVPDNAKTINALVSRYGGEVYDALGIQPALDVEDEDASIREVVELMRAAPPAKRREITFAVRAMAAISGQKVVKSEGRSEDDKTEMD